MWLDFWLFVRLYLKPQNKLSYISTQQHKQHYDHSCLCVWLQHGVLIGIQQCFIYFENPRHTQSMIAYLWFWLSISENSSEKLHCGNVVNMPYSFVGPANSLYWIGLVFKSVYPVCSCQLKRPSSIRLVFDKLSKQCFSATENILNMRM